MTPITSGRLPASPGELRRARTPAPTPVLLLVAIALLLGSTASAEPMFLAKQYTRCTGCHYSPTGGGLLTPYGRLLSQRELSAMGSSTAPPAAGEEEAPHGEQAFLFGALGEALGPVHLGIELRPSHLRFGNSGGHRDLNFWMNADVIAAVQKNGWTAYGTIGRVPGLGRVPPQDGAT